MELLLGFIPNFSEVAKPLIKLTEKFTEFQLTKECQTAFELLKELLTTVPVSVYPDMNKQHMLYIDASDRCIAACLTQVHNEDNKNETCERPVYYLSYKLATSQSNWPTIEEESLAVFCALQN